MKKNKGIRNKCLTREGIAGSQWAERRANEKKKEREIACLVRHGMQKGCRWTSVVIGHGKRPQYPGLTRLLPGCRRDNLENCQNDTESRAYAIVDHPNNGGEIKKEPLAKDRATKGVSVAKTMQESKKRSVMSSRGDRPTIAWGQRGKKKKMQAKKVQAEHEAQ